MLKERGWVRSESRNKGLCLIGKLFWIETSEDEMDGEGNTVPFLEETLVEEKKQSMMCQHLF